MLTLLCGQTERRCPAETVAAADCGQHALDEGALVRLIQELFGVATEASRREGRGQPIWLGGARASYSEVHLWLRPQEPDFSDWLAELVARRGESSRSLVLVPTSRRVRVDTFERHGPGQPVEIVHLDRALALDGARVVRTSPNPVPVRVPWPEEPVAARGLRLRLPAGVRWAHITIEHVEDDILGIRVGAHPPVRVTAAELGLTRGTSGRLSDLWELLRALCDDGGTTTRARVGAPNVNALRVQASRLSDRLCTAFGIAQSPLHVEAETETVRADFVALPEPRRTLRRRDRRSPP